MKIGVVAGILLLVCMAVYWPKNKAEFVLDDYYTVVRNPLIKNPAFYPNIWTSHLFDANQSSGYIKFGYWRPVLESSWVVDYRLFGLKAYGYQWINLLIHFLNCLLVYILFCCLFEQRSLAFKSSLIFAVLPTQEWVVRYITGRADELSVLFALIALLFLIKVLKNDWKTGFIFCFIFWTLSCLTREVALSYILIVFIISMKNLNRFSFYWVIIGLLPLALLWSIIPKQGNILAFHIFYFSSIGLCLWLGQLRWKWSALFFVSFALISFYQGHFWTTEQTLLRHTRSLELWPRTVVAQQLMMKYDDDTAAIDDLVSQSKDMRIKAMWLRRLGVIYFKRGDLAAAQEEFAKALSANPVDVDTLDSLAVVAHIQGQEDKSLQYLNQSLSINPYYPDTLKTLGIAYDLRKDYVHARQYLIRCLVLDPDNSQARVLLASLPS